MKRFHVHVAVDNLEESIRFYSVLFGTQPSVTKPDYAKWMLEDPRVNFAISHRGHAAGVNHLGFQVDSTEELQQMRAQLDSAETDVLEQTGASCCYAKSNKHWVKDPAGIAWETFYSLSSAPMFGEDAQEKTEASACCIPLAPSATQAKDDESVAGKEACCVVPLSATTTDQTNEKKRSACCR